MRLKDVLIGIQIALGITWYALGAGGYRAVRLLNQENQALCSKLGALDAEISALERVIVECNDPFFIEKYAREKCGLCKPGDEVYITH